MTLALKELLEPTTIAGTRPGEFIGEVEHFEGLRSLNYQDFDFSEMTYGQYQRAKNVLRMNAEQNFRAFDDAAAEWRVFWGEFKDRCARINAHDRRLRRQAFRPMTCIQALNMWSPGNEHMRPQVLRTFRPQPPNFSRSFRRR